MLLLQTGQTVQGVVHLLPTCPLPASSMRGFSLNATSGTPTGWDRSSNSPAEAHHSNTLKQFLHSRPGHASDVFKHGCDGMHSTVL